MNHPLQVNHLTKVYGKKNPFTAVDRISFDLKKGEILGLLGPNGSGKTTTIQMLLGTLSLTSGSIYYFGKEFTKHRSECLQSVSFASTYTSLPYLLSVYENLKCFAYLYSISDWKKYADPLLERFGIMDKKNEPIASLSAGQITRLMLVKAFFTSPKVVLLDEPTASLDPEMSFEVCNFLLEERKKRELSIIFTSHKMEEVTLCCDRTIFLKDGKIIADDLPVNLAKSVSSYELKLTIMDGMEKAINLAQELGIEYKLDHQMIILSLKETQIPPFLQKIVQREISYSKIQILEPSLDKYFLKLTGKIK